MANTSLAIALEIKAAIYAAAIPEYWVIDLTVPHLHILRQPQAGQYRDIQTCREGTLTPLAFVVAKSRTGMKNPDEPAQFPNHLPRPLPQTTPNQTMPPIKKQIIINEAAHPVAVIIDYQDWQQIEALLQQYAPALAPPDNEDTAPALAPYAGRIHLTHDPLTYQQETRNTWL